MPDRGLAQFPAQQEDLALHLAGEIEQPDIEIFHLHAGRVNFAEGVLDAPNRLLALRLALCQMDHIQHHAAGEKNSVRRLLQLGVHVFYQLLAVDCLPEERFQNRQEHLRFIEGKGAFGHVFLFYWNRRGKECANCSTIVINRSKWGRIDMALARTLCTIFLTLTWACTIEAQEVPVPQLTPGSERGSERGSARKPASASV